MQLYLLRHGIAKEREEWSGPDDQRPLTKLGRERTREVLLVAKEEYEIVVDEVWSSPYVRAWQTAEIAADILGAQVLPCEALECGAGVPDVARFMAHQAPPKRLMLVGHEPDMGFMLAELTGRRTAMPFKKAGLAFCKGDFKRNGMKQRWKIRPRDVLRTS